MSLKLEVLQECLTSARAQVADAVTGAILAELIAMESERLRESEESQSRKWNGTFKVHQIKVIALAFRRAKNLEERS